MVYKNKYKIYNKKLYIPSGTVCIHSEEFKSLYDIESVYIPQTVVSIESRAFSCCFELKKVIFEDNSKCKFILDNAFELCKNLYEINLPNSVKILGDECFLLNTNIKSLLMPSSIKEIGKRAFGMSGIEELIFNSSDVPNVTDESFYLMNNLQRVTVNNIVYNTISGIEAVSVIPVREKKINDVVILKGNELSSLFTKKNESYFMCKTADGKFETMNKNLRLAFQELEDKRRLDIINIAISENWNMNTKINYRQYAAMSQNCWIYTLEFMKLNNISENDTMSIADVIKISKGRRHYDVFCDFVRKYVQGGESI